MSYCDIKKPLKWVVSDVGKVFPFDDAVKAGRDGNGNYIFVARAYHDGGRIPGAVIPKIPKCSIPYGNNEQVKDSFEVLCGTAFRWEASSKGQVASNAFPGGNDVKGETLYIGRAIYKGSQICGKIHPSQKCLYIAEDGKEIKITDNYEILVGK